MISKERFFAQATMYQVRKRGDVTDWRGFPEEGGIYAIMNSNRCMYIGQTANFKARMGGHMGSPGFTGVRELLRHIRDTGDGGILFLAERSASKRLTWEAELQAAIPTPIGDSAHGSSVLRRVAISAPVKQILLRYMAQTGIDSISEALETFCEAAAPILITLSAETENEDAGRPAPASHTERA